MILFARTAMRAAAIQPFRRAQGPELVEGLDWFVVPHCGTRANERTFLSSRARLPGVVIQLDPHGVPQTRDLAMTLSGYSQTFHD
jgi:hypothetical protein